MKSKNIWKYGFNWGSAIGGVYFLYSVLGFVLKIDKSFFWSLLGTLIIVFGLSWAMQNYRKNIIKQKIKFGKYFGIGTIMSLFISLFSTLYMAIYVLKLQPNFFNDFFLLYQEVFDSMNMGVNIYDNPQFLETLQIAYLPSSYISNFIFNLFCVLLLSILYSQRSSGENRNVSASEKTNDYVPYQEIKKEESENEMPKNEIEGSEKDNSEKEDN